MGRDGRADPWEESQTPRDARPSRPTLCARWTIPGPCKPQASSLQGCRGWRGQASWGEGGDLGTGTHPQQHRTCVTSPGTGLGGAPTSCALNTNPTEMGTLTPSPFLCCPLSCFETGTCDGEEGKIPGVPHASWPSFSSPNRAPAVTGEPSLSQYGAGPNSPCLLNQTFSRGRPLASPGPASLSSGFEHPIAHPCAPGSDLSCSEQERGRGEGRGILASTTKLAVPRRRG